MNVQISILLIYLHYLSHSSTSSLLTKKMTEIATTTDNNNNSFGALEDNKLLTFIYALQRLQKIGQVCKLHNNEEIAKELFAAEKMK